MPLLILKSPFCPETNSICRSRELRTGFVLLTSNGMSAGNLALRYSLSFLKFAQCFFNVANIFWIIQLEYRFLDDQRENAISPHRMLEEHGARPYHINVSILPIRQW